jgi:poly(glycerol-phosphate) alpha-glucosyltransferase
MRCNLDNDKPHRILIVTGALYHEESGPFLSVKEAAYSILKYSSRHAVTLIGTTDSNENSRPDWYEGIDCLAFKRFGPRNFHISPRAVNWLKNNISSFSIVIIQSIWSHLHLEAARICRNAKVPYMFVIRGNLNPAALEYSKFKKSIATRIYGAALRNANCYQALNDNERKMIRNFGIQGSIAVIPNGVTPLAGRKKSIQDFNAQNIRMLYLGRINPIKGLDRLLSCLSEMQESKCKWNLTIAGDESGDYAMTLKERYDHLIRRGLINFVGPMYGERKLQLLLESDLFILPSYSEGMPMAVLEAASIGLPCAITKNCGLEDLINKGGAYLVGESDDDMFNSLSNVLSKSPEELYVAGKKGREFIYENYSWQRIVSMYDELFEWLNRQDMATPNFIDSINPDGYRS